MGFRGSKPSPSSLRDATSPERGRFYAAKRQMQKAPPSGELSSVCETERVRPPQNKTTGASADAPVV